MIGGPLVGWIGLSSLRAALVVGEMLLLPNSFLYARGAAVDLSEFVDPENS